jgi:hypothetical protein
MTGDWRKIRYDELHILYTSINIVILSYISHLFEVLEHNLMALNLSELTLT